jgi:hypothetical protein
MTTVITKQHDTKIIFKDTPTIDGVAVSPPTFNGATLTFLLKDANLVPPFAVKQPAVINPDGTFQYQPLPTDVANAGDFQQEWEVVYPGGAILTFPNNGWNVVKIISDLG